MLQETAAEKDPLRQHNKKPVTVSTSQEKLKSKLNMIYSIPTVKHSFLVKNDVVQLCMSLLRMGLS